MKTRSVLAILAILAGAPAPSLAQARAEEELVWPLPPDPPRIRFVGQLRDEGDIGKRQGFLTRMKDRLAGTNSLDNDVIGRPHDVYALDAERIYITDGAKRKVLLFDLRAKGVRVIGEGGQGALARPMGIDGDDRDRIYVADASAARVTAYDRDGTYVGAYGGQEVLHNPVDVAVDAARDQLWVVDSYLHQVLRFSISTGELLGRIGKHEGDLAAKRELLRSMWSPSSHSDETGPPEGLDPEVEGEESPTDARMVRRDLEENRGAGPGEFRYPAFVATAPDGTLYVTDQMNFRIQAFDPEGTFLRAIGRHGSTAGGFARPKGVAVDREGHVYVADAAFNNVQIFDSDGRLLLFFATGGHGEGELYLPLGLGIDDRNLIYIADRANNRIQLFEYLPAGEPTTRGDPNGSTR